MAQPTGGKTKETFITLFHEKKSYFILHLIYYENNSTIKQFKNLVKCYTYCYPERKGQGEKDGEDINLQVVRAMGNPPTFI